MATTRRPAPRERRRVDHYVTVYEVEPGLGTDQVVLATIGAKVPATWAERLDEWGWRRGLTAEEVWSVVLSHGVESVLGMVE